MADETQVRSTLSGDQTRAAQARLDVLGSPAQEPPPRDRKVLDAALVAAREEDRRLGAMIELLGVVPITSTGLRQQSAKLEESLVKLKVEAQKFCDDPILVTQANIQIDQGRKTLAEAISVAVQLEEAEKEIDRELRVPEPVAPSPLKPPPAPSPAPVAPTGAPSSASTIKFLEEKFPPDCLGFECPEKP